MTEGREGSRMVMRSLKTAITKVGICLLSVVCLLILQEKPSYGDTLGPQTTASLVHLLDVFVSMAHCPHGPAWAVFDNCQLNAESNNCKPLFAIDDDLGNACVFTTCKSKYMDYVDACTQTLQGSQAANFLSSFALNLLLKTADTWECSSGAQLTCPEGKWTVCQGGMQSCLKPVGPDGCLPTSSNALTRTCSPPILIGQYRGDFSSTGSQTTFSGTCQCDAAYKCEFSIYIQSESDGLNHGSLGLVYCDLTLSACNTRAGVDPSYFDYCQQSVGASTGMSDSFDILWDGTNMTFVHDNPAFDQGFRFDNVQLSNDTISGDLIISGDMSRMQKSSLFDNSMAPAHVVLKK